MEDNTLRINGNAGKTLEIVDEELRISSVRTSGDVDLITITLADINSVHIFDPDNHTLGILTVFTNSTSYAITYTIKYKEAAHVIKMYIYDKNHIVLDESSKTKIAFYKKPHICIALVILLALIVYESFQFKPASLPAAQTQSVKADPGPSMIKPITKSGSGKDMVQMDVQGSYYYRCQLTNNGKEEYIVYNPNAKTKELAFNTIGTIDDGFQTQGQKDEAGHVLINIEANGDWTLKYEPLQYGGNMEVSGEGVYISDLFEGDGVHVFNITHTGEGNFAVWCDTGNDRKLVVSDTGAYEGKVTVDTSNGNALWQVVADGKWSITKAD